jgi:lipoyl(octanoyl) transferase
MVDFEGALALQRRLVYEVGANRDSAALLLCEHPPLISVGRRGSWAHIDGHIQNHRTGRFPVRWVNRGGGCILHCPGQLALYPIFPLDRLGLGINAYLEQLRLTMADVLDHFRIRTGTLPGHSGISVGTRPIAEIGIAVRDWISYFGAALNVNPDLLPFRGVSSGVDGCSTMTSIERERHGPLRPALVRELLIEEMARHFGFTETLLFSDHPLLKRKACHDALASFA